MSVPRVSLTDYAAVYVRLFDGSPAYYDQFRWTISSLQNWFGRVIFIDELTEQLVNDYLVHTRESLAPITRQSRRNTLLRLWRHAATNPALQMRPTAPNRDMIGKVKKRQTCPRCWSHADVQILLAIADKLKGYYLGGISKRLFWRAWILSAWSTGFRRCDLMGLRRSDITALGRLSIVQTKTGRHVTGTFSKEAISAIDELCLNHHGSIIFPLWCRIATWRKIAKRIVKRAGIGMSIGKLRGSAGTAVENDHPGKGPQFLGNSPQVFYGYYYDRTIGGAMPEPPPLSLFDISRQPPPRAAGSDNL